MTTDDPDFGNYQQVVRVGKHLPEREDAAFPILLTSDEWWSVAAHKTGESLDESRAYWARYEDAFRRTWETRNPSDRSTKLKVRRVWWLKRREESERRERGRARVELKEAFGLKELDSEIEDDGSVTP
jgi:hypothetical protein